MMKNRFVFEAFLGQAGRGGVKLMFELQGEAIKPIENTDLDGIKEISIQYL